MGKKLTTNDFNIKAKSIHNDKYNYSLVEYINSKEKVKIICPIHGMFEQTPNKHLQNKGCSECGFIQRCLKATSNTKMFISKAIIKHGYKYDYSKVIYIGKEDKVDVICEKHGVFKQTPHNHLAGHGCPICCESKGEKEIKNILIKYNVKFNPQHRFNNCRNILPLPFDFYLPDLNICIEYQGIQHFKPRTKFGGVIEYDKTLMRDNIKSEYCKENNINLFYITYKEDILTKLKSLTPNIFMATT